MNIITVIPLSRSKQLDTLSYFTAQNVPLGAIVTVPVRSKTLNAVVIETRQAEDIKIEIKKAPYVIRKLSKVKAISFFPEPFVKAAKKLANYYIGNVGAIIESLVSQSLLDNASKLEIPESAQGNAISRRLNLDSSTYAIQGDDEDRLSSWRSLIRQEFARKKSLVFYVPTIEDAESLTLILTKGIEGYIYTLHSSLTEKKTIEVWKAIAKNPHPVVIVATASFSLLPRTDIDTVIIERENGRGWRSERSPYIDLRHALEVLAHDNGQVVYRGDSMLKIETLKRLDANEINQGSPFKWRSISLSTDILIDMTQKTLPAKEAETNGTGDKPTKDEQSTDEKSGGRFRVLSPELIELISKNHDNSGQLFIYTQRRGHSPMTVCGDCQNIVTCNNCLSPVVLHTSKENGKNFFMCHRCGERRSANETCKVCDSWRLTPLGIGIDKVEDEIRNIFPNLEIFKIDADSAKNKKQITQIMDKFRNKPGSLLLGTEIALSHLRDKIDHAAIVSLDSLFSLPDFRIPEKIMYILIKMRAAAQKTFLVQTRRPEEKIFEFGLKGNLSDFYRQTLAERKQFDYPPYVTLIKITITGKKDPIAVQMAEIEKLIQPLQLEIFPAFTSATRGNSMIHGLVKIDTNLWPNTELISKLKTLPQAINVKVDPESLL